MTNTPDITRTTMHTPAPWEHDGNGLVYSIYVKDEGGTATFICDVAEDSTHAALCGPTLEEEANARLIAAAPELLDALQELADAADATDASPVLDRPVYKARAAIAKTSGRAV